MFLLKKVFQLRDHVNPEEEKPFLEHLEDMRIMITRVMATLLISTVVCFAFKNQLLDILRKPVEEVWIMKQESTLPEDVTLENWERSLELADAANALNLISPTLAETFWKSTEKEGQRALAQAAVIYRAAKLVPEKKRQAFLDKIAFEKPDLKERVVDLLERSPATDLNGHGNLRLMSSFKPTETFMLTMKLAFFAGIVLAFPLLLYFILQFILPGMRKEERKILWPALAIGFGLFLIGVFFAYFLVLPQVLTFFYEWGQEIGVSNDWRIGYYISFATQFVLIFGLAFELPVVVMTLVYLGILSYSMMSGTRAYAVVAIMIVAAIITPTPDIATLSLLAAPMYFLYEICIWLAFFYERKQKRHETEDEEKRMDSLLSFKEKNPDEDPEGDSLEEDMLDDGLLDEAEDEEFDHEEFEDESGEEEDVSDPIDSDDLIDIKPLDPDGSPTEDPDYDPLSPGDQPEPGGKNDADDDNNNEPRDK